MKGQTDPDTSRSSRWSALVWVRLLSSRRRYLLPRLRANRPKGSFFSNSYSDSNLKLRVICCPVIHSPHRPPCAYTTQCETNCSKGVIKVLELQLDQHSSICRPEKSRSSTVTCASLRLYSIVTLKLFFLCNNPTAWFTKLKSYYQLKFQWKCNFRWTAAGQTSDMTVNILLWTRTWNICALNQIIFSCWFLFFSPKVSCSVFMVYAYQVLIFYCLLL